MTATILLHALAKGATEDWQADLITARPDTAAGRADVAKARVWAESNGFHRLTETRVMDGALPNFAATMRC